MLRQKTENTPNILIKNYNNNIYKIKITHICMYYNNSHDVIYVIHTYMSYFDDRGRLHPTK